MAARLGLEPRQNESESFVLPLHHRAVGKYRDQFRRGMECFRTGWRKLKRKRAAQKKTPRPRRTSGSGAGDGIRTRNRLFTKQVLYH